ncbi:MAG: 5-oxoprolinase subunit PxpB [Woeseiaceae bacterium]|nr:5-oxoprolinase subunit PxpB [Woeseiaceae bacterium]
MNETDITLCGDDLLSVAVPSVDAAQRLAEQLRSRGDWIEVVGGIDSVVAQFDASQTDVQSAIDALLAVELRAATPARDAGTVEIPVRYGGENAPDFGEVCRSLGLTREEFVALHTRDVYRVDMLGFTPGFAYIGGLDERLNVPRLATPRQHVEAGAIGIAGGRTGVYALPGPGGWPLIGRTELPLFDARDEQPFLLQPGMRVRFTAQDGGR